MALEAALRCAPPVEAQMAHDPIPADIGDFIQRHIGRLMMFGLIIVAIIQKNRPGKQGR